MFLYQWESHGLYNYISLQTAKRRPSKVSPEIHHTDGTRRRTCSCFPSIPIEPKCNQHISTTFSTLRPQEKICGVYVIIHFDPGAIAVFHFGVMVPIWFPCFQASSSPCFRGTCARVFVEDALGSSGRLNSPGALQLDGQRGVIHGDAPDNGEVPRVFVERFRTEERTGEF